MTISERVYRLLLRAYPSAYRREYAEPMVQLFRDQMRDCGRDRARIVWFWLRTLADTAQAVPAVHLETVMGPEGRLLKSRLALAVVASLLLLEAERYLLHITLYRLPSTISQLFLAHRPLDPLWRWVYVFSVFDVFDVLAIVIALTPLLAVMHRLNWGRIARAVGVVVGTSWAIRLVSSNVVALWFLGSRDPVLKWLMPFAAVAVYAVIVAMLNVGRTARFVLAALPVVTMLLGRRAFLLPQLISHSVGDSFLLLLCAGGFMLLLKRLGIHSRTRAFLAGVPVLAACPVAFWTYGQSAYLWNNPTSAVLYFAHAFHLPICLAAGAWAAGAGDSGQRDTEQERALLPT